MIFSPVMYGALFSMMIVPFLLELGSFFRWCCSKRAKGMLPYRVGQLSLTSFDEVETTSVCSLESSLLGYADSACPHDYSDNLSISSELSVSIISATSDFELDEVGDLWGTAGRSLRHLS